jgi:LysM repeat protein
MRPVLVILVGSLLLATASGVSAQTLKGSRIAMQRQHEVARAEDLTFLRDGAHVRQFVSRGLLVPVSANGDYELIGVSFPYARPALKTFITRLARQYRQACGERLVLTSLTRPLSEQPRNASDLSVHPAGMAADLRVSRKRSCERWLGRTLLSLESRGLLEATRERRPPHFHVALFPEAYLRYVNRLDSPTPARLAASDGAAAIDGEAAAEATSTAAPELQRYQVNRGDSLWAIARRYHTTVAELKELNNLRNSRIAAGQVLAVPPVGSTP